MHYNNNKIDNYEKHKEELVKRFEEKLSEYSCKNMPLKFIGYCLPDISFQDKQFTEALNFFEATFYGATNFGIATFSQAMFEKVRFVELADFTGAEFFKAAEFTEVTFSKEADFINVTFQIANDTSDLSMVSFAGSDISKVTFTDKVRWGGDDGPKVIEEEMLKNFLKYSFDFEDIATPNSKDSDRLKDFLTA